MKKNRIHKRVRHQVIAALVGCAIVAGAELCAQPLRSYMLGGQSLTTGAVTGTTEVPSAEVQISDEMLEGLLNGELSLDDLYSQTAEDGASQAEETVNQETTELEQEAVSVDKSTENEAGKPVSSAQTAGSAGATSNSTASSEESGKQPVSSQPSTGEAGYEQEIKALIQRLYVVKARANNGLDQCIEEARAEYKALPEKKQTRARKIAICLSKASQLQALQASCDKEVDEIVTEMRRILQENGQSTQLADAAEATYQSEKSNMYATLMEKLYS